MRPADGAARPAPTPAQQGVVRLALLAGALLFGGVIAWLASRGSVPIAGRDGAPPAPENLRVLRLLGPALAVGAVAAAAFLRAVIARTTDPARVATLRLAAWTIGDGAALLGGVYWLLSGDPSRYVIGLVAMLATYVAVPLRAR